MVNTAIGCSSWRNPELRDGLLLLHGGLINFHLKLGVKHPIILPPEHHVVALLVQHMHAVDGLKVKIRVQNIVGKLLRILSGRATVAGAIKLYTQ